MQIFDTIVKLRNDLLKNKISLDNIWEFKDLFKSAYEQIQLMKNDDIAFEAFIMLCLDYYTYSESGDVLITDREYDIAMQEWVANGNKPLVYPDPLIDYTTWKMARHTMPGLVGTVKKIYSEKELDKYLKSLKNVKHLVIAPKYDGVSTVLDIVDGKIIQGLTRADGIEGQDITELVRRASNTHEICYDENEKTISCHMKCELLVSGDNFTKLLEEKNYSNRRSATSGIVNTPKNINLGKYLTIMPLMRLNNNEVIDYYPTGFKIIKDPSDSSHVMSKIEKMLRRIRSSDFQFRTDGVVLFPVGDNIKFNEEDYMDNAMAYKVNTAEAYTTVEFGYVSLGRKGYAVPMAKVKPVEVNETIVTDVSLGSFDKFRTMSLHEKEMVIVFSAGDVIPQIKIPEKRMYPDDAEYIDIKRKCPYCNEKLERFGGEYKCTNEYCPRVNTGRITNFLDVLGAENFSDATVEAFYNAKILRSIEDIFSLTMRDILSVDGFKEKSASNIMKEIEKIKSKPINISKLFGSLGIKDIGEKKAKKILQEATVEQLLEGSYDRNLSRLLNADGIGGTTAEVFLTFIKENKSLIKFLMKNMNIIKDKNYRGNVVFTGFRNGDLEKKFNDYNIELGSGINSKTIALICASYDLTSTKCKAANKKRIPIYNLSEVDKVFKQLDRMDDQKELNISARR